MWSMYADQLFRPVELSSVLKITSEVLGLPKDHRCQELTVHHPPLLGFLATLCPTVTGSISYPMERESCLLGMAANSFA